MGTRQVVIDTTTLKEIVQGLSEKLRAYYVFPDVAEEICAHLQKRLDDGEYADIAEGEFLAFALTQHMQDVSQDEHLWVRWHPEPLPDHEGELRHNREWMEEQRAAARLHNYGLHRVERLPGSVGYLDIRKFHRAEWGGDVAAAAMNLVANAHALIIDLRKCEGGCPGMVALISSYLFGEEPVHLNSLYWREDDVTEQFWTLPHVPGQRFGDKPVYVLTGKDTFSAGEEFAYNLKTRRRATLVGETTGGGAHPGASYRLEAHFEVFIPVGRAINPITQDNWQGSGVVADVSVPQEQALAAAYSLALRAVIESIGRPASRPLSLLLEEAQAALADLEAVRT